MLRHNEERDICDRAGWATIAAVFKTAQKYDRPRMTPSINQLIGIVLDDDKGRFQMAVVCAVPTIADRTQKLRVFEIGAIRAVSGHTLDVDQSQIATPLTAEHAIYISALTHKTRADNIPDII
eukprot:12979680-Heterocapsa_arctica.AAC.1